MDWDEGVDVGGPFGPYNPIKSFRIYTKSTHLSLLEKGYAYKDFKEGSEDFAIRFKGT